MRVLLYGINYSPELTGVGKYTGEMAAWLAAAGHDVRVVTAPPYYPHWQVLGSYRASRFKHAQRKGVDVWRCPVWVPSAPGGLKRVLHLASFAISSTVVMALQVFWRPQLVWVVEPALFCAPTAWAVARLGGAKAWLHVQDFELDAGFSLGIMKGNRRRQIVWAMERWLMRRFDVVSAISGRMCQKLEAKGVPVERITHFPNWVDVQGIQPLPRHNEVRAELGIPESATVALYSGNMGGKQGLEILAHAAALLKHQEQIVFVFCGNGAGRADLVAQSAGLPNVHFLDLQPPERLPALLAMADIHLLPQRAGAADLVMPSKLTGMLASARPVVATADVGTELQLVVSQCGLVVPPEQPRAFAAAIRTLAEDPDRRALLGRAARAYAARHMDMEAVLSRFEAQMKTLAARGSLADQDGEVPAPSFDWRTTGAAPLGTEGVVTSPPSGFGAERREPPEVSEQKRA